MNIPSCEHQFERLGGKCRRCGATQRELVLGPNDDAPPVVELLRIPAPSGKHYAHYLTTAAYFKLDAACIPLWSAFGSHGGVYMVGSVLRKPDWRDVDIRVILEDAEYDRLFPVTDKFGENAQWKIFCISISSYLSSVTGLPIDFQIQRQTQANEMYAQANDHLRNAIGLFVHSYDNLESK